MECPHCKKDIYGMTGLQELQKFQKHLRSCRKNPNNKTVVTPDGSMYVYYIPTHWKPSNPSIV